MCDHKNKTERVWTDQFQILEYIPIIPDDVYFRMNALSATEWHSSMYHVSYTNNVDVSEYEHCNYC